MWGLQCLISVVTIQMELYLIFGTKVVHFGPSYDISGGIKTYFRTQKGINFLKSYYFGVQKRVSEFYLMYIGQLDINFMFETKSGSVQDFQGGKQCWKGE